MKVAEFQQWLNARGGVLIVDGRVGPATLAAIDAVFTNPCAAAITEADVATIAQRLGCSAKRLQAVATVESSGSGFDRQGRPKILFERHLFHRLTKGRWTPSAWSQVQGGGYGEDSWDKLGRAAGCDPLAAFAACSWGKFQVLAAHAAGTYPNFCDLGYADPLELAYSTVTSEAAHYELLARYIEKNGLVDEMRALSKDPDDCRAFARAYNGPAYADGGYHRKLARAMT